MGRGSQARTPAETMRRLRRAKGETQDTIQRLSSERHRRKGYKNCPMTKKSHKRKGYQKDILNISDKKRCREFKLVARNRSSKCHFFSTDTQNPMW